MPHSELRRVCTPRRVSRGRNLTMDRPRAKSGPKPKGNRFRVTAALPVEVVQLADSMAERDGVDRTAVLGRLLCEQLGLPVPHYCLPPGARQQQELPLSKAS